MKYIVLSLILFSLPAQAVLCDGLFVGTSADMKSSSLKRKALAKKLIRLNMSDKAYVAQWGAKHKLAQGPFTKTGETLVMGLEDSDFEKWMNAVGKVSVGIGIYGLPEDNSGTAYLRVGEFFFNHEAAAEGRRPKKFKTVFDRGEDWSDSYGLTESTIMMSPKEIKDILAFYKARGTRALVAKEDMRGYKKGDVLYPDFHHSGQNLVQESCAGACTSFLADFWLDNLVDQNLAERLKKIRETYNLNYNYVARANVWQNFRNPEAHITLMHIEESDKDLVDDFIGENSWGNIRGLYKYAFMPDGRSSKKDLTHSVASYESRRLTVAEYLEDQE